MNMSTHHSSGMAHPDNPAKQKEHMAVLDLVKHSDATHVAVKSGNWSDASTWQGGKVPGNGAEILIGNGLNVNYNVESDARLKTIRVDGQLDFATKQDTKMVIDTFVVAPSGTLTIGTKGNPVAGNVNTEILIADNGKIDRRWDPTQVSRGIISHGEVEIYGQQKTGHIKLSKDAMAGDRELVLSGAPKNWKVGDSLVLTGTKHVNDKWNPQKREMEWQGTQDEELTIKAIDGNRVTLDRPLTYDHNTPRGDLKAYVTNFSRNVTVASENAGRLPANQRGHVMFMHSDAVDVRYAEFHELGRSDKSEMFDDRGGSNNNIRGRYAVHFHRSGVDDTDGQPARAIGNSVWGSPGWGFVNHDSHVVMENNSAYDVFGSAFVTETGNEIGAMRNNIAIKSEGSTSISKSAKRVNNHDIAHNGVGFWFQGRLVDNEGNIAAGQRHAGTVYLLRGADQIDVLSKNLDFPETGRYRSTLFTGRPHIESLKDHEVFATDKGIEVIKANPNQGHDVRSVIDGLKAWEVRTGTHLEYTSKYTLKNLDLIGAADGNNTAISFGNNAEDMVVNGAKAKGFGLGIKTTKKHTFANIKDWGYVFVDTDVEGKKINVDGDKFLSGSALKKGRLALDISSNTDFHFNGSEEIKINGTKTDSIGSTSYWTGSDSYKIKSSGVRNRIQQGYYTDKNGTPFVTIEERIADRATGETLKLEYVVTIDGSQSGLLNSAPKLGTYGDTVKRGLAQGSLKSFLDRTSGKPSSNGDTDHSDMDMGSGDMDMGSGDMNMGSGDMDMDSGDDQNSGSEQDMDDAPAPDAPAPDAPTPDAPTPDAGPAPDNTVSPPSSTPAGDTIRLEAEDMTLDGYRIERNGKVSGGEVISFVRGQSGETGTASTTFNGPAGTYDVKVGYIDETDGQAQLEAKVNGKSLETWQLTQNLGENAIGTRNQVQRTLGDRVSLAPGDRLQIVGQEQGSEHARVDYVELIPVTIGGDSGAVGGSSTDRPTADRPVVDQPDGGETDGGMNGSSVGGTDAPSDPIRVEAEDMSLTGYRIEQNGTFSGGKAASLVGQQRGETGNASTTFDGPSGTYDVVVAYTDETDGVASLEAKLNGESLETWQLDQNLGKSYVSRQNQVQRTVAEGVEISSGDRLELMGQEQGSEHARVDYVEFIPVAESTVSGSSAASDDAPIAAPPAATEVLKSAVTLQGSGWKNRPIDYQVTPNTMMQLEFRSDAEGTIHAIGLDNDAFVDASDQSALVQLSGTEDWGVGDIDYVTSSGWQTYDIPVGQFASGDAAYLSMLTVGGETGDAVSEFRNVRLFEALGSDTSQSTVDPLSADPLTQSANQSALAAMNPDSLTA